VPSEGRPFEARAWTRRGSPASAARRTPTLTDAAEETAMQVTAISTPRYPEWRWRITGYAGEVVEESQVGFPSIASAVAAGTERLVGMNVIDAPIRHHGHGRHVSGADDRRRVKENEA
jgi:hypothetical protein